MLKNSRVVKSKNFNETKRIVVLLHGYGTSGEDFAKVGDTLLSKILDDTVFLFPDAPYQCEAGVGRKWFNLNTMSFEELRSGLEASAPLVYEFVQKAAEEYRCKDISVIGFSQGAMLAFEMLYYPGISKIIPYSGIFAFAQDKAIKSKADVLIVHSYDDFVVPYKNAELAMENLEILGLNRKVITCHDIGHSISIEGWEDGMSFIRSR